MPILPRPTRQSLPQQTNQPTTRTLPRPPMPHHRRQNNPTHHRRGGFILTTIKFFIPGTPAPQGSKRALGPGRMIESSKNVGPWRERIAIAAHNAMRTQLPNTPLFDSPIAIFIDFILPRPKSTPKTYTPAAIKRPDIDKLARAVLDAITGTIIRDDAQIVELHAHKRLAHADEIPGAMLEIIALRTDRHHPPPRTVGIQPPLITTIEAP